MLIQPCLCTKMLLKSIPLANRVMWFGVVTMSRTCSQIMPQSATNNSCGSYRFLSNPYSISRHTCFRARHKSQSTPHKITHKFQTLLPLPTHTIGKMIFHPSVCSLLLFLLHGGHPDPTRAQSAGSTRHLKHEDVDSPAPTIYPPTTYSPTTERPSLPIPSYSPTQSFEVADLIAPSPPNCAPIGSRTTATPTAADDRRYDPPVISVTNTPTTPSNRPNVNGDPTDAPFRVDPPDVTFRRGDLRKDIKRLGIKVSKGITVRVIANAGRFVNFANGDKSSLPFHSSPDGAAVFPLTNGGYVYVSNSEVQDKRGGVYGVYMDDNGNVVDYKQLLSGTTRNCSGGATPWKTYVSCEEYGSGQCYQVDPDPASEHHLLPEMTVLGGKGGGNFEAVVSSSDLNTTSCILRFHMRS